MANPIKAIIILKEETTSNDGGGTGCMVIIIAVFIYIFVMMIRDDGTAVDSAENKNHRIDIKLKNESKSSESSRIEELEKSGHSAQNPLTENPPSEIDKSPDETEVSESKKIEKLREELAAIEDKISSERKRWRDGVDTINRLTNFKKTPVKEGSEQYHQCLVASKIVQEVEAVAPALKAEKARLEAEIKSMQK